MSEPAKHPYRLVFFGTSDFPTPSLEALLADPAFKVTLVVTQPDKPVGRSKTPTPPPAKRAALSHGLPVWQPESLKTSDAEERLALEDADAFIVAAYGKILPERILAIPRMGSVNIHGSLLPRYRGASPVSAAIAAGDRETGVTIMKMDAKMDEGPTLAARMLVISDEDTSETLMRRLADLGATLLGPTLKAYLAGELQPVPQDPARATMTRILTRDDGAVDWSASADAIERSVRAMKPWPEAWTTLERKGARLRLTIKTVTVLHPAVGCPTDAVPGEVFRTSDGSMAVCCGKGALKIERLQIEGKSETDAKAFLNGYPDTVGKRLGEGPDTSSRAGG